ncbi:MULTISPECIES: DUF3347 domain-containing protein [Mesonia]|uniref:Uncharacterized protein n=1 Tax=Mesonia oceanica TaxID=2687242 RepID=A0AC61Y4F7_9FLAO|nr:MULTISPECIES: DUF3347 domain-containing protein [Mesonia]MAN29518.1 hypothetical protein [Mesonia sp.]MAQ41654.1 hypothetical protein [Mesonia sp.]MBJ98715.1 hypothetical protein [Flavobacteriaceae bacterium]VVU99361.1 hypothetical protein FVB9532_00613 [Mesonia oceanica]|tara:strand:- start:17758 stop:18357 length:600 start_codon:yes stop_codon:yes gene_type:complete
MRKLKKTIGILTMTLVTLTAMSCKDGKKEGAAEPMSNEMHQEDGNNQDGSKQMANAGSNASDAIIDNYLKIKNALVADNQVKAAEAGGNLVADFDDFDKASYSSEEQQELTDIIEDAKEHAEHISESPMEHQREHFDILSKDVIDMIAITGTDKKLYQDFCPMYNDNKGAQWLSASKEIKNPYYGSKMMGCGEVQKEIN